MRFALSPAETASILSCSLVELLEGIVLGEQANLDFVTGDVEEGRIREE